MNELEALLQGPGLAQLDFVARCAAWISVMADEPNLEPLTLLSGPLGVLCEAEARGLGAIGVMQWY
ncbi:hypothetical protein KDK95_16475 [Actinospica sp. MGRD01-02]|uniref:Uncharacterized protein n=1 Tax=Actinospica acidithermotolerans TaxID=2828514 RepID=A0A941EHU3_9ACTN|nr:hypothetical protein [Actinospica acidithermotolerans]MBR7827914.1 hypothetical protein [Actinospica acidithermotolerans]